MYYYFYKMHIKMHLSFYFFFCSGNILVIVIVAATKTFHTVTSVLIINLAISDFLVGIGVMPFVAVSIMNNGWVNCSVSINILIYRVQENNSVNAIK